MRRGEQTEPEAFAAYLDMLCGQVRCKRAHGGLRRELGDHLEEQREALEAEGLPPEEAAAQAVASMGDPVETGQRLDRIHRPRMEWGILTGIFLLYLAGVAVHVLPENSTVADIPSVGIDLSAVYGYLSSAAAGLLCLLVVRRIDYTYLARWPRALYTAALAALLLLTQLPGGRLRPLYHFGPLLVFPLLGFVFSQRGKGWRGLAMSLFAWSAGFLPFLGRLGAPSPMILYGLTGLVCILAAVLREWFLLDRRKGAALVLVSGGALCAVLWPVCHWASWPFGRTYLPDPFYRETAQTFLRGARLVGASATWDTALLPQTIEHNTGIWSSGYQLTALVARCGWLAGAVVILLLGGILAAMVWASLKNGNPLGSLLSLGCAVLLGLEVLAYLLANFGLYVPEQIYLPFLTSSQRGQTVDLLTAALLLSCWRSRDLLPEGRIHGTERRRLT